MRLPEAIIALLRSHQFSIRVHGGWVLQACTSASNQMALDLTAVISGMGSTTFQQQQLMQVLDLIIQKFPLCHLYLAQNNMYGQARLFMQRIMLSSLLTLDLANCSLDGEDLDFSALANGCPQLENLILEGNDLRPWHDASMQGYAIDQTHGFEKVLRNLLCLVRLENLRVLDLSKTNIEVMHSYLGAVIWFIVSNSALERLELRGLGLTKKAFAYCIAACGQLRRDNQKPVTIVCEGSKKGDFFRTRIDQWNRSRQKANEDHVLGILSLFTRSERLENNHNYRSAGSVQQSLSQDTMGQCDMILKNLSVDVSGLWSSSPVNKKRKKSIQCALQSKRQKNQMVLNANNVVNSKAGLLVTAKIPPALMLFKSPEQDIRKGVVSNQDGIINRGVNEENVNPQVQIMKKDMQKCHKYEIMDLPVVMRIKITEYLGESRCPIIMK